MRRDTKILCPKYLEFIRTKSCVVCSKSTVDAHHLVAQGWRQAKRNDFTALPLCREHHQEFHRNGGSILGIDLWREAFWHLVEYLDQSDGVKFKRGKI